MFMSHHQDMGGFFVAVITKVKPLPWTKQGKEMSLNGEFSIRNQLFNKCWAVMSHDHQYEMSPPLNVWQW